MFFNQADCSFAQKQTCPDYYEFAKFNTRRKTTSNMPTLGENIALEDGMSFRERCLFSSDSPSGDCRLDWLDGEDCTKKVC